MVQEGEVLWVLWARFLYVFHLMDEEDAIWNENLTAQSVRLLVVVCKVSAVRDHLKVFLLVDLDKGA